MITFLESIFTVFEDTERQRILEHLQNLCKRFQMLLGSASGRLELHTSDTTLQWTQIVKILQIWTSGKNDRPSLLMTINGQHVRQAREIRRLYTLK